MRNLLYILILLFSAVLLTGCFKQAEAPAAEFTVPMQISSPAFKPNEIIPSKYTCDGDNVNPPLIFGDVPAEAKSLALIVDDPDAPSKTWVHWVIYNISPSESGVEESSVPPGSIQGMNDSGIQGYSGPCPPSGEHRYFFKLYALDSQIRAPLAATKSDLEKAMEGHILAQAEIIGVYQKQ